MSTVTLTPPDVTPSWHEPDMPVAGPPQEVVITRSEERLDVTTIQRPVTRVRFRKRIVTETRIITVEVSREELVEERETIDHTDDQLVPDDRSATPRELDIVLYEQRPVITMETVAVERILIRTNTITEDRQIVEALGKEQVELHRDQTPTSFTDS